MKRLLLILLVSFTLGVAMAAPESVGVVQRIENASTSPTVTGGDGRIYFSAGNTEAVFSIYSITGQLLKTVRVSADGHVSIDFPKGFYVVRCNNQRSRKVVVK